MSGGPATSEAMTLPLLWQALRANLHSSLKPLANDLQPYGYIVIDFITLPKLWQTMFDLDGVFFESVENEDGLSINADNQIKSNLAGLVEARYADAQRARDSDENRWITAYHNFRGLYPKNIRFRNLKNLVFY